MQTVKPRVRKLSTSSLYRAKGGGRTAFGGSVDAALKNWNAYVLFGQTEPKGTLCLKN